MRKILTFIAIIGIGALMLPTFSAADPDSEEAVEAAVAADSLFERAVEIIKKYETLHKPRHWPLVGYGHKVLPGERFSRTRTLTEAEADALLRKDLLKNCAVFRSYGADSLLLGVLAYNIGSGAVKRSSVTRRLTEGDRDIRDLYISHCRYQGKVHNQIRNRRIEEFDALFADYHMLLDNPKNDAFLTILQPDSLLTMFAADTFQFDTAFTFQPLISENPPTPRNK